MHSSSIDVKTRGKSLVMKLLEKSEIFVDLSPRNFHIHRENISIVYAFLVKSVYISGFLLFLLKYREKTSSPLMTPRYFSFLREQNSSIISPDGFSCDWKIVGKRYFLADFGNFCLKGFKERQTHFGSLTQAIMCRVKSFCGCCSLKAFGIVFGWINLVLLIIFAIIAAVACFVSVYKRHGTS